MNVFNFSIVTELNLNLNITEKYRNIINHYVIFLS